MSTKKSSPKKSNKQFGKISLITRETNNGFLTHGEIVGDIDLIAQSLAEVARKKDNLRTILFKAFTILLSRNLKYKTKKKVIKKKAAKKK